MVQFFLFFCAMNLNIWVIAGELDMIKGRLISIGLENKKIVECNFRDGQLASWIACNYSKSSVACIGHMCSNEKLAKPSNLSFRKTPLKKESFDLIIAVGNFNFSNEEASKVKLGYLKKALKPDGDIFITINPSTFSHSDLERYYYNLINVNNKYGFYFYGDFCSYKPNDLVWLIDSQKLHLKSMSVLENCYKQKLSNIENLMEQWFLDMPDYYPFEDEERREIIKNQENYMRNIWLNQNSSDQEIFTYYFPLLVALVKKPKGN